MRPTRGWAMPLVLGGVIAAAVQASSAQPAEDVAELRYSPTEGPPGTTIAITGRCLYEGRPADRALVALYQEPPTRDLGVSVSIPVAADGSVGGSLRVPVDAVPGPYRVTGSCAKSDFTIGGAIRAPFQVTGQLGTTSTTTAPVTTSTTSGPVTNATATIPPVAPAATARPGQPSSTG